MSTEDKVRSASASRCLPPTEETGGGASINLDQAARIAETSTETVRRWAIERGIGVQEGRAWRIDPDKLGRLIAARRVFRGDFSAAPVQRANIVLRASEPLKEAIETAAKSAGLTPSEWVRCALVDWLIAAGFAPEARATAQSSLSAEGAQHVSEAHGKPTEPNQETTTSSSGAASAAPEREG